MQARGARKAERAVGLRDATVAGSRIKEFSFVDRFIYLIGPHQRKVMVLLLIALSIGFTAYGGLHCRSNYLVSHGIVWIRTM